MRYANLLTLPLFACITLVATVSHGQEVEIVERWRGAYQIDQLDQLPQNQQDTGIVVILNYEEWESAWGGFSGSAGGTVDPPEVDFQTNLVVMARNVSLYNAIDIGRIHLEGGKAVLGIGSTLSARPIEDVAQCDIVVIPREGIEQVEDFELP